MKIGAKITIGFLIVALLTNVGGYFAVAQSRKAYEASIVEEQLAFVKVRLQLIDNFVSFYKELFSTHMAHMPLFKETLRASNTAFERMDNVYEYIKTREDEWSSVQQPELLEPMLINTTLSNELKRMVARLKTRYGYPVLGEVFVTNRYGAVAAMSGKTTDYLQSDEEWWQKAKQNGYFMLLLKG